MLTVFRAPHPRDDVRIVHAVAEYIEHHPLTAVLRGTVLVGQGLVPGTALDQPVILVVPGGPRAQPPGMLAASTAQRAAAVVVRAQVDARELARRSPALECPVLIATRSATDVRFLGLASGEESLAAWGVVRRHGELARALGWTMDLSPSRDVDAGLIAAAAIDAAVACIPQH